MNWYNEIEKGVFRMAPSKECINLVAKWEGFRKNAYLDTIADPSIWTIGYGETLNVSEGDSITKFQAKKKLGKRLKSFWEDIETSIEVPLEQPMCDALTSFTYNVGVHAFKTSTLLRKLNKGDYEGAADELLRWNKAGVKGPKGDEGPRGPEGPAGADATFTKAAYVDPATADAQGVAQALIDAGLMKGA